MHTTNTASRGLAATYVRRREECERLAELSRQIERFTTQPSFQADPAFEALEAAYRQQLQNVLSLSL